MKDEHLDKLFRDALENQEATPSAKTWDAIQAALAPKVVPLYERAWFRLAGAAVAFIVGTFYFLDLPRSPQADQVVKTSRKEIEKERHASVSTLPSETTSIHPYHSERKPHVEQKQVLNPPLRKKKIKRETPLNIIPEKYASLPASTSLQPTTVAFNNELTVIATDIQTYKVVEIDPIQPLIESPEQEEILLAKSQTEGNQIIPTILNKITEVINPDDKKIIRFSHDEEGSFQLDISNSYVKSRLKKRK